MKTKKYALFEPGGRQARGFSYGKLVEVRYLDVAPTGIESPDYDEFIQTVEQAQLSEEDPRECRIGYVDEKGVGTYSDWQEFLDMATESS